MIAALLALGEGRAELVSHSERSWASVTFNGSRHEAVLDFTGIEAGIVGEALIEALPEHVFTIPGQIVADLAVIEATRIARPLRLRLTVELLLLEDA